MPEVLEIDCQHRALLEMLNRLGNAVERGDCRESVDHIIDEVIFLTCFHFMVEERLMAEYGYPEIRAHRGKHRQLTRDVLKFKQRLRNLGDDRFIDWFRHWPFAYMQAHIACADRQVELYIRAHNSGVGIASAGAQLHFRALVATERQTARTHAIDGCFSPRQISSAS